MTEAEAVEAIAGRWSSEWVMRQPSIPFALQNEAFRSQDVATFATVTVGPMTPRQLTQGPIGSRLMQYRGTINVKLYGPLDAGAQPLALLAGDVRAVLASQVIGGALYTLGAGSIPGKEGRWYTLLMPIAYEWHDRG